MSVYFNKKEELKEKAVSHTKMMEAGFKEEIDECVRGTKIYGGDGAAVTEVSERMPEWILLNQCLNTVPERQQSLILLLIRIPVGSFWMVHLHRKSVYVILLFYIMY